MTEWQTIDTAPKDGTRFLGLWPPLEENQSECEVRTWWVADRWENPYESSDVSPGPTHWMPLPQPPAQEE